ncbi:MAG: acetyl-CoA carboxylase biotin carboxyl carrier protein subunit [Gemmatimonadetes bacterium]|nr:acetyl-CoA carboxylase biotin carboxyl carrier protein subunit [Gemmatimonadota bacterium]
MRYHVTIAGRTVEVELAPEGVRVDGEPVVVELRSIPDGPVRSLLLDGASHRLVARAAGRGRWELQVQGQRLAAEVLDERTRAIRELTGAAAVPTGPKPVRAPMPGLVVRVEVAVGDLVQLGQGLVIVEAMKMENELRAETAGRVTAVHIAAGEAVERDQVLIDLAAEEEG